MGDTEMIDGRRKKLTRQERRKFRKMFKRQFRAWMRARKALKEAEKSVSTWRKEKVERWRKKRDAKKELSKAKKAKKSAGRAYFRKIKDYNQKNGLPLKGYLTPAEKRKFRK